MVAQKVSVVFTRWHKSMLRACICSGGRLIRLVLNWLGDWHWPTTTPRGKAQNSSCERDARQGKANGLREYYSKPKATRASGNQGNSFLYLQP